MPALFIVTGMKRLICVVIVILADALSCVAQYDSSYIGSYDGMLIGRFLVSRKYTQMTILNKDKDYRVRYSPNKTFSVGLGASYRFATVNLAVGVLKPNLTRGETRDLDLQLNNYGRRFVIDFILQLYKGFYLPDKSMAPAGDEFYIRPDLYVSSIGGSFQYVLNNEKFSYRAVFQQTEVQKRSAGSFLLGLEAYVGRIKGDSSIVPSAFRSPETSAVDKMRYLEFGPNGGYAYTWVLGRFFLTGSVSASLNATIKQFFDGGSVSTNMGVSPNTFLRGAAGYNTDRWSINFFVISTGFHFPRFEERTVNVNSGRFRMNVVYRFKPNRRTKEVLKVIDDVDEKL